MKVAIIGYGKMGKIIEGFLIERGHSISFKIDKENFHQLKDINRENTDVCIEFTGPNSAKANLEILVGNGMPVVCGSTGWYSELTFIQELAVKNDTSFVAASNFSIGVNLFFEAAKDLSKIMKNQEGYGVSIRETHHTQKLDAPSGTAITLSEEVSSVLEQFDGFSLNEEGMDHKMPIYALREEDVPGTHELVFRNEIDEISLKHIAFNRNGFALGAVVAAEYIFDKKGVFTIREILKLIG